MVKRKGKVLMGLDLACLLAALCIAAFYIWQDQKAGAAAQDALMQLNDGSATVEDSAEGDDGVIYIDGNAYIGRIVVPAAGVELPVMADWSMEKLDIAPCRYSGNYTTDDLVIAGHSYSQHFSPLYSVQEGDEVYFVTVRDNAILYKVVSVEQLEPAQVDDMIESDYDLTLFTCTNDGMARWTVRCMRDYS